MCGVHAAAGWLVVGRFVCAVVCHGGASCMCIIITVGRGCCTARMHKQCVHRVMVDIHCQHCVLYPLRDRAIVSRAISPSPPKCSIVISRVGAHPSTLHLHMAAGAMVLCVEGVT